MLNIGAILSNQFLSIKSPNFPTLIITQNDFDYLVNLDKNKTKAKIELNVNRYYRLITLDNYLKKIDDLITYYFYSIKKLKYTFNYIEFFNSYKYSIKLKKGYWYELVNGYIDFYNNLKVLVDRLNDAMDYDFQHMYDNLTLTGQFNLNIRFNSSLFFRQNLNNYFMGARFDCKQYGTPKLSKNENGNFVDGTFFWWLTGKYSQNGSFQIVKN